MPAAVPAAVLAVALALSSAGIAHAAPTSQGANGKATAVVLRTGLDVSLLDRSADVPLNLSFSDLHAPADAHRTALTARLGSVDHGHPFRMLRAGVATARATADSRRAEGYVKLVHARVSLPGLPLLGLFEAGTITSRATCEAGKPPIADSHLLGRVAVLGRPVTVSAGGPATVTVPGIGKVRLDLSRRGTTSRTAAATALVLTVAVKPLDLNVAEVTGRVTLAAATCESPRPAAAPEPRPRPAPKPAAAGTESDVRAQNVTITDAPDPAGGNLADTGGSPATQYLAAGSAALLCVGCVAAYTARRRKPVKARTEAEPGAQD
jgi:hypothetical protein